MRSMKNFIPRCLFAVLILNFCSDQQVPDSPGSTPHDRLHVDEDPVVFNSDGGWCWYQDERAVIDNGTLLFGGVTTDGDITLTGYDLESGERNVVVLHERLEADDHNAPSILVRPDGRYVLSYTRHSTDNYMRYRISAHPENHTEWQQEQIIDVGDRACYSNVYHLEDEGLTYNFHRGRDWDPNYLISDNQGDTWDYGGKLWKFPDRPYPRYTSNERDEIHIVTTEAHPRDYTNSIYHGFIRDGHIYHTDGALVGELSTTAESDIQPMDLTKIFQGDEDHVAWTSSIELDDNGNPYIGYTVTRDQDQQGSGGFDHRYRYARWDGSTWMDHEIAYAGSRLYAGEDEYTGLITLHPDDPDMVYISADVDPVTGEPLISRATGDRQYEIFQGITDDMGATWSWEQVTEHSETDNIRPVIVTQGDNRVLLWLRGEYRSYTDYQMEVVGFVTTSG